MPVSPEMSRRDLLTEELLALSQRVSVLTDNINALGPWRRASQSTGGPPTGGWTRY